MTPVSLKPQDVSIDLPSNASDSDSVYCEPLAGRCQRLEDCLSIAGEVTALSGFVYSLFAGDDVLKTLFGFTAICFLSVIIFNKTCGNLPRINQEFVKTVTKLHELEENETKIVKEFEAKIHSLQELTAQGKQEITSLSESNKTLANTEKSAQENLIDLRSKIETLGKINQELSSSIALEQKNNEELKSQIAAFGAASSNFHTDVSLAATKIEKLDGDLLHSGSEILNQGSALHHQVEEATKANAAMNQALLNDDQKLESLLGQIQQQLEEEKKTTEALKTENKALTETLKQMSSQLSGNLSEELAALKLSTAAVEQEHEQFNSYEKLLDEREKALLEEELKTQAFLEMLTRITTEK